MKKTANNNQPKARKSLGQHFLRNPNALDRLVEAIAPQKEDIFIEIGCGDGALTLPLSERCRHITAIEIDQQLATNLRDKTAHINNLTIINADALKDNLDDAFAGVPGESKGEDNKAGAKVGAKTKPKEIRIVGNLPYNISVHLMERFLLLAHFGIGSERISVASNASANNTAASNDAANDSTAGSTGANNSSINNSAASNTTAINVKDMHFLVQKEIAQRLLAAVGGDNYCRLSLMRQTMAQGEKLFDLPPRSFVPPPKVMSSFVRLTPCLYESITSPQEIRALNGIITSAFSRPNRHLRNTIKELHQQETLQHLNLAEKRAKQTSLTDFISIMRALS